MRQFLIDLNAYVAQLSTECNNQSCAKMEAGPKIQYRCAAHSGPKDCCAIDYCVHTIDQWTTIYNDTSLFPHGTKV